MRFFSACTVPFHIIAIAPKSGVTSPQTSEPAAIIRAALQKRSLCLFIFKFRYLLSILIFGKGGRIRQPVHTF